MKLIHMFFRWLRLLLGSCPACNSSAPECFTCYVCEDYRGGYPSDETKERWRRRLEDSEPKE